MAKIIKSNRICRLFGKTINGVALWPFVIIREDVESYKIEPLIRHETIHIKQQTELLLIGFFFLYSLFYIVGRLRGHKHKHAYRANPFEREAYDKQHEKDYLEKRNTFAWTDYI